MKKLKNKPSVYKNYFNISKLNNPKFLSYLPSKKNIVLDFGCGNGIFDRKFSSKKIKLIKMYDKNKKLKFLIDKKYNKNPIIKWTNSLNVKYNVVLINSVIQYLTLKNYKSLMKFFFKRNVDVIIISDVPKFPYYIEAFFCIFVDLKKILSSIKYLFQKDYNFFFYKKKKDLLTKNKNYIFKFCDNLNEDKLLRNTILFYKISKNNVIK